MKELKPIIITGDGLGQGGFYQKNEYAQNILLKALSSGITDVQELRRLAGLRTAVDVYRTLDKMAIRKDYHRALSDAGLSLDYVVGKIKNIIDNEDGKDDTKLKALQTLMTSLGLDKYQKEEEGGKNWEEAIIGALEKTEQKQLDDPSNLNKDNSLEVDDYEVVIPEVPQEAVDQRKKEEELGKEIYGDI
jgi:hypothetical protein